MFNRKISTQFIALFLAILVGTLALLGTSTYTSQGVEKRVAEITDQTLIVTKQLHDIRHAGSDIAFFINENILQTLLSNSTPNLVLDSSTEREYERHIAHMREVLSRYSRYVDEYFPNETQTRDEILLLSGALTRSTSSFFKHINEMDDVKVPMTQAQMKTYLRDFKTLETEFLARIDAALDWESDELRERIAGLNASLRKSQQAVWIVFGVLFSLVLFAGLVITRKIIQRIQALNSAVKDISLYDLSARIDESGSDELSELAALFNTMAQRLEDMNKSRDLDEENLKNFNEQLNSLVEAQTKELRTAKDRAESASRAKSRFLSAMSHELRTPLNAILGYAQILNLPDAKPSSEDAKQHVAAIVKSSETLLALIDEVLTLSTLDSKTIPIQLRSTSLQQALNTSIENVEDLAKRKKVSISNEVNAVHLPRVHANKDHLQKVLFNLLTNAVKYNRDNGRVVIKSAILHDQNKVRITIQDTGLGFIEDYPGQILEPFERLAFESSPIEGGGVGLTIVQRFLTNMEGELGYRSVPEQGSEFWIDLPAAVDLAIA